MWTWAEFIADHAVRLFGLDAALGAGAALHFFVYDLLKIVVLIAGVAFIMALVRGALPLERIRVRLEGRGGRLLGYPAAATLGALTPFCSCSSVPIFLGFVQARFPIGVAFAFLITSPLVNKIAVALMAATFGWKFALIYTIAGITLGISGGIVLTFLRADRWLVPGAVAPPEDETETPLHGWRARIIDAADTSRFILRKIAPWLLLSLGLGAGLHGFVPGGFFENLFAGTGAWTVPLLEAFVTKGVPLGTALAFLLSAVGVSFPELVLLRAVMSVRLLVIFSIVVLVGTTLVGWLVGRFPCGAGNGAFLVCGFRHHPPSGRGSVQFGQTTTACVPDRILHRSRNLVLRSDCRRGRARRPLAGHCGHESTGGHRLYRRLRITHACPLGAGRRIARTLHQLERFLSGRFPRAVRPGPRSYHLPMVRRDAPALRHATSGRAGHRRDDFAGAANGT